MKDINKKFIGISLILTFFTSCMTVAPDNRSKAVSEFRKLGKVLVTRVPLENSAGPVFKINATSNNAALMVAGQIGIENGYKYFLIIDSGSNQQISGYLYQGTGGITTSTTFSITIVYTNNDNFELKYNAYECSLMLDGYKFVTKNGKITLWTLFGTTLVGGSVMMISPLFALDTMPENTAYGLIIGGGALMLGSLVFIIPLW